MYLSVQAHIRILYIQYFYLCVRKYVNITDILLETSIKIYFYHHEVEADL